MITPFGKSLRNIRMDRGMLLKDMAQDLDVTSSYLSAVEVGKQRATAPCPCFWGIALLAILVRPASPPNGHGVAALWVEFPQNALSTAGNVKGFTLPPEVLRDSEIMFFF